MFGAITNSFLYIIIPLEPVSRNSIKKIKSFFTLLPQQSTPYLTKTKVLIVIKKQIKFYLDIPFLYCLKMLPVHLRIVQIHYGTP